MPLAYRAHLTHVLHRYRLPAARVIGHRQHHQRDTFAPHPHNQRFERRHIHVAFERIMQRWLFALGNQQVNRFGSHKFDIGPGRVEVSIVGNDIALLARYSKENPLGRASLVCRNHMLVAHDLLHRVAEPVKAPAARVAFIALHHSRPLMRRHGPGA